MGCSVLTNHPVPSLGFRVNALSSTLPNPWFSLGGTPIGAPQHPPSTPPHLGAAVSAFQPRGTHPTTSREGPTRGFAPPLAPHLGDPGHPKPVGGGGRAGITSAREGGHAGAGGGGGGGGTYLPMERMVTSPGRPPGLGTLVALSDGSTSGHFFWLQRVHGAGPCTVWRCCWCRQAGGN